jgi:hypothetical protein
MLPAASPTNRSSFAQRDSYSAPNIFGSSHEKTTRLNPSLLTGSITLKVPKRSPTAGLDFAIEIGVEYRGFVPKRGKAEDGRMGQKCQLKACLGLITQRLRVRHCYQE